MIEVIYQKITIKIQTISVKHVFYNILNSSLFEKQEKKRKARDLHLARWHQAKDSPSITPQNHWTDAKNLQDVFIPLSALNFVLNSIQFSFGEIHQNRCT